jgi:hypothetical protein
MTLGGAHAEWGRGRGEGVVKKWGFSVVLIKYRIYLCSRSLAFHVAVWHEMCRGTGVLNNYNGLNE